MSSISEEDKKIFFDNLHVVQKNYSYILREKNFKDAEDYKKDRVKRYIIENKDKLLELRKVLGIS